MRPGSSGRQSRRTPLPRPYPRDSVTGVDLVQTQTCPVTGTRVHRIHTKDLVRSSLVSRDLRLRLSLSLYLSRRPWLFLYLSKFLSHTTRDPSVGFYLCSHSLPCLFSPPSAVSSVPGASGLVRDLTSSALRDRRWSTVPTEEGFLKEGFLRKTPFRNNYKKGDTFFDTK